jgi:hypothetical protein
LRVISPVSPTHSLHRKRTASSTQVLGLPQIDGWAQGILAGAGGTLVGALAGGLILGIPGAIGGAILGYLLANGIMTARHANV